MPFLGVALLSLFCSSISTAQDGKGQQIVRLKSGGFVSFKTTTEPAAAQEFSFSGAEIDSDVVHRVLVDKAGNFYFGYDLLVEPVIESRQFRVRVVPLSREFEEQLKARKNFRAKPLETGSKLSAISQSSFMETLNDGDGVALDVLVNPDTKVKIVDLISVSFDYLTLRESPATDSPARDYTLDDVELKVSNYKLLMNGNLLAGGKPTGGYGGPIIWVYIPSKGRFIFSLAPREGYAFRKVGKIEHNKIIFNSGSDRFELISSAPVIGSGGNWNIWVLQDRGYVSEFSLPEEETPEPPTSSAPDKGTAKQQRKSNGREALSKADAFDKRSDSERDKKRTATEVKRVSSAKKPALKPLRLIFGAADRIENLLPRN
jgi:hypothetical protein